MPTFNGFFLFVNCFDVRSAILFISVEEAGCGRREGMRSRTAVLSPKSQRFDQELGSVQ